MIAKIRGLHGRAQRARNDDLLGAPEPVDIVAKAAPALSVAKRGARVGAPRHGPEDPRYGRPRVYADDAIAKLANSAIERVTGSRSS